MDSKITKQYKKEIMNLKLGLTMNCSNSSSLLAII